MLATLNKTGSSEGERELLPAVRKGWRRKCPKCGQGPPLMDGYLKIRQSCSNCSTDLHHHLPRSLPGRQALPGRLPHGRFDATFATLVDDLQHFIERDSRYQLRS